MQCLLAAAAQNMKKIALLALLSLLLCVCAGLSAVIGGIMRREKVHMTWNSKNTAIATFGR